MKGNLLVAAFAALFSTSIHAHPRLPEPLHFQVSIDVAKVTDEPIYAVLFLEAADLETTGQFYATSEKVDCSGFKIDAPDVEISGITLYGSATCTLNDDSTPPKEYVLASGGSPPVTKEVVPPTVFVGGKCCVPAEGDGHAKLSV